MKFRFSLTAAALINVPSRSSLRTIRYRVRVLYITETIVGVILKDGFLLTLEKLLRENGTYLKKNKQWVYLALLANVTRKSTHAVLLLFFSSDFLAGIRYAILTRPVSTLHRTVTEENCDRVVRGGLMQYALDVFDVKQKSASKISPKILSSALDTLVHVSNTGNGFHFTTGGGGECPNPVRNYYRYFRQRACGVAEIEQAERVVQVQRPLPRRTVVQLHHVETVHGDNRVPGEIALAVEFHAFRVRVRFGRHESRR